MDNLGYLFVAYTIIFVVIFGYVLFIWRRQAALAAELHSLEARLAILDSNANPSRTGGSGRG